MGEFDLSLIEEFRSRRSLYDRNSPQFKDKVYNAQQWHDMSNKLGFDVSILKDRMLQLRNRYNLEKRRMEQLRDEVPGKYHESPWPLYESLQFLSDHIKSRRRYKSMLPVVNFKEDAEINESGNDYSAMGADDSAMVGDGKDDDSQMGGGGGDDGDVSVHPFANGLLTVKVEDNSEDQESEVETENHRTGVNNHFADNSLVMTEIHSTNNEYQQRMQHHQLLQQQHIQQQQLQHQQLQLQLRQQQRLAAAAGQSQILPTRIIKQSSSNTNDLENRQTPQSSSTPLGGGAGGNSSKRTYNIKDDYPAPGARKHQRLSPREYKYNAFGNFVASSLLDLPQKMALELVEKFTSDIVKALTMKMENAEAAAAAAAASTEDSDHHSLTIEQ